MALRNAVGGAYSASSVKNDGGSVVKGGNVASDSPMTNSLGLDTLADDFGASFGSKVVAQADTGDKAGVQKAVSGGTLAYQAGATEWVVKGGNVASTIGGVSNDALASPARDTGDLNDFATEAARTKISDRLIGSKSDEAFNMFARPSTAIVPGRTKGSNAGDVSTAADPTTGSDTSTGAVAPTQAVPGELTYHFGALAKATTDEYKAKNVLES
tara:strand:+ start:1444 stop:2085 length:642 start_codon:yes stop_codon:yes gene_type:complete